MAGFHGKNAQIKLATTENVLTNYPLIKIGDPLLDTSTDYVIPGTGAPVLVGSGSVLMGGPNLNLGHWRYGPSLTSATLYYATGPASQTVDANGYHINYGAGAVVGVSNTQGYRPVSGIFSGRSMQISTVASIVGSSRNISIDIDSETVDTTTMNESWRTQVEGIQGWSGSMDGLFIDETWYHYAVASLSGTIPRYVLEVRPDPAKPNLVYTGTAFFPTLNLSAGYDQAIQNNVTFQGIGPLNLIDENNKPYFGVPL